MKRYTCFIAIVWVLFTQAQSYTTQNIGCLMHIGTHQIGGRFALHNEIQWRRTNLYERHWQLLINPGLVFYPHPDVKIGVGGGYFDTEIDEKIRLWEYQIWEHLIIKQKVNRLTLLHRYRFEQRFLQFKDSPSHKGYANRFRISTKFILPFKAGTSFYLTGYEELFLNFAQLNIWEQNLAYIALGKSFGKHHKIEFGYLPHHIFSSTPKYFYHNVQLAWFWNIPIYNPNREIF